MRCGASDGGTAWLKEATAARQSLCFAAPVFFYFTLYWRKVQRVALPWGY
jgi:hypothetical protein